MNFIQFLFYILYIILCILLMFIIILLFDFFYNMNIINNINLKKIQTIILSLTLTATIIKIYIELQEKYYLISDFASQFFIIILLIIIILILFSNNFKNRTKPKKYKNLNKKKKQ